MTEPDNLLGRAIHEPVDPKPRWTIYEGSDPWDDVEPLLWYIANLLPKQGVMWVAGTPHAGKSLLILFLCLAIAARRKEVLGFEITDYPNILYVSREDGRRRIKPRRADILSAWGMTEADLVGIGFIAREPLDLQNPDDMAHLVADCKARGVKVLVLDTWTALTPQSDPDSAKDQAALARIAVDLADKLDGLVIVVDHARKNPPAGVSVADIYGPNQKAQRAEHAVVLRKVEGDDHKVEILIDSKDLDGEVRFYAERSQMGSQKEKWTHGGAVVSLGERSEKRGDVNRDRVYQAVQPSPAWMSSTQIRAAMLAAGHSLGKTAVNDHLKVLVAAGKLDQMGDKLKDRRYQRLGSTGSSTGTDRDVAVDDEEPP